MMKKFVLKVFFLVSYLTVVFFLFNVTSFAATTALQTWDLVDSGKHMDYDGDSKYMSLIKSGASTWNAHKKGVIREDTVKIIQDVYCSDISKNNSTNATTYSSGKIQFNKKLMDKHSANERQNVATHELGHTLGLGHNTKSDVMYMYSTTKTTLSSNDKASYDKVIKHIKTIRRIRDEENSNF